MPVNARQERILDELERNGFASVINLSDLLQVSEVTVRRDLEQLEAAGRLRRTHGGALSVKAATRRRTVDTRALAERQPSALADRVDVLVTTPVDPAFDRALLDRAAQRNVPVIAESVAMPGAVTMVAPDNAAAGFALGQWAGQYAREHLDGRAYLLDLTFDLPNTRERSDGFLAGLRNVLPDAQQVLSINAGSTQTPAYQITRDVLAVHPEINIIFAINDATAAGAARACRDHGIAVGRPRADHVRPRRQHPTQLPLDVRLLPGGARHVPRDRGADLRRSRDSRARWPASAASSRHADGDVLTAESLSEFYERSGNGWDCNWQAVEAKLKLPLPLNGEHPARGKRATSPHRPGRAI